MPGKMVDYLVVGAGAFGAAAALELARRGHSVALVDPGPLPHPEASSTDISKVVRMDYGDDAFYSQLAEVSLERWHEWNDRAGHTLYHESGFVLMKQGAMTKGGFEFDSRDVLAAMGYPVQRLDGDTLHRRFPAWPADVYHDGYFNPAGGWAESGNVVSRMLRWCAEEGVDVREGTRFEKLLIESGSVRGMMDDAGKIHAAGGVVVAAGAWTPVILPWTSHLLRTIGQPVFHLQPADTAPFQAEVFPVWAADISETGWYGFPAQPDGIVKIANHGDGLPMSPFDAKDVPREYDEACRTFLGTSLPLLSDAPIVARRLCMYCDTPDGDFLIDRDPERPGLTIAAGGSGHGFKFVPVLGELIADAAEGRENPWLDRFRMRGPDSSHTERARFKGEAYPTDSSSSPDSSSGSMT
jgi:glycine/D-amino acid oxidase-like deaminating enzyme